MNESTARVERFEPASAASPFYTWEVPQKPLCVRIPFALIDRMEHEAVESFRSLSSRGSEVGGILLGRVVPGDPAAVCLEDYELIPCDYSRGPLYRLSETDLARFDAASSEHGSSIMGFFRSHTRKGVSLDEEDIALMHSNFRDPRHIALLIRPFATKASAAGIFLWENGVIRGETSYLEFPFRSSQLPASKLPDLPPAPPPPAAQPPSATASAVKASPRAQIVPIAPRRDASSASQAPVMEPVAQPAAPPEPEPAPAAPAPAAAPAAVAPPPPVQAPPPVTPAPPVKTVDPAPAPAYASYKPAPKVEHEPEVESHSDLFPGLDAPPKAKGGKLTLIVAAAAVVVIALVALFVYPGFMNKSRSAATAVQQDANVLGLHVERSAGDYLVTWNRDADAIRKASHATLSIVDGDQHANYDMDLTELRKGSIVYTPVTADVVFTMDVIGPTGAKTTEMQRGLGLRNRPSPLEPGQPPAPAAKNGTKPTETTPAAANPAPQEPAPAAQETAAAKPERQLKQFRTDGLVQRLRPATAADLPDAPTVGGAGAGSSAMPLNLPGGSAPPSLPAPTATPSGTTTAASKGASTGGKIQPAILIRKKEPEFPRLAKEAGASGTVELLATIGIDGKVKSVKVLKGHPMLVKAATDAVMQWVYRPTLLNGVPVENQTQISLNFVPSR